MKSSNAQQGTSSGSSKLQTHQPAVGHAWNEPPGDHRQDAYLASRWPWALCGRDPPVFCQRPSGHPRSCPLLRERLGSEDERKGDPHRVSVGAVRAWEPRAPQSYRHGFLGSRQGTRLSPKPRRQARPPRGTPWDVSRSAVQMQRRWGSRVLPSVLACPFSIYL